MMQKHDLIQKIANDQRDDHITGCSLDHPLFKRYYKITATELSKI